MGLVEWKGLMDKIRICQMITELRPAGAERCLYELATRLDKDRFDVRVLALRGGAVADWLAEAGIRVDVLGVRGKWDVLKLGRLAELLRDEPTDILHTHLFHADLAGRAGAALAAVPSIVHTVHCTEERFRPWHFAFARFFSGSCQRIICISQSVLASHSRRSGLPAQCYMVIPNGIDISAYARNAEARVRLRREWSLGEGELLAAFVGRLVPEKGIETLLGVMSHLASRGQPLNLVIAGDGPLRDVVSNYTRHGEGGAHCRALGHVRDVPSLLSAADMLISASWREGFGLAVVEGMAASLPVAGTDVTGTRDVVVPGDTGLLVPSEDVVALANAVERLANDADLRNRMGRAGRQRAEQHFTIGATVAAHEALYEEIASATR